MALAIPLVLVPGPLCSARLFTPQVEALWPLGPVTIADHRHDGDDMEWIAASVMANAPPYFALAGLSMGGYIALAMMRLAPNRIAKLALLDTSARPDTDEQKAGRDRFIAMAEAGKLNEIVDTLTPKFLHAGHANNETLKGIIRTMAEETGADAFVQQTQAIKSRADSRPGLAEIKCPTLVLVGDGDTLTPPELSQEISAGISGSKLVVVPNCGHLSTLEQPDAVNRALAEWLESD